MFSINVSNRQIKNFIVEQINSIYDYQISYQKTKSLDCSHNLLVSTDGFSKFSQLYSLNLSHNKINQIFQMCSSLVELNLSHNKLNNVFNDYQKTLKSQGTRLYVGSFIQNLINLRQIDLSFNEIQIVPSGVFENNKELRVIHLNNNQLKGPLWCFNKLEHLESVDIGYNQLSLSDIKPLEKLILQFLDLKYNPLEVEGVEEKLQRLLVGVSKIHLSYILIENIQDQSYGSTKSGKALTTSRSTISLKKNQKTPVKNEIRNAKTPTKVVRQQQQTIRKSITPNKSPMKSSQSISNQQIQRQKQKQLVLPSNLTPQKKNDSLLKEEDQKLTIVKVPQLDLEKHSCIKALQFEESPQKFQNTICLEEEELVEELHELSQILREKRQQHVNLERSISKLKNTIKLIKLLLKGIFLYDTNALVEGFDEVIEQLEIEFIKEKGNVDEIMMSFFRMNPELCELNEMWDQLQKSEKIIQNIKQIV